MSRDTPQADPEPRTAQTVEVAIASDVYDAALARAQSTGTFLAAVARAAMYKEAGLDPLPPLPDPPGGRYRVLREYGQDRTRLRFKMLRESYDLAKTRYLASGRTVAGGVEDALREYARTGTL